MITPSYRVRNALDATPTVYLRQCLASRLPGGSACGSVFTDYADDFALLSALYAAPWEPFDHPDVASGATAYRAPLRGRLGLVALASLDPETPVTLEDPKGTGTLSAVVTGVHGEEVAHATLILGPSEGAEIVYTFHPGDPVRPSSVRAEGMDGRRVTVAECRALGLDLAKVVAA